MSNKGQGASKAAVKELITACGQPGCPICRIAETAAKRYLDSLFYEHVNDAGVRKQLRASLGFCNLHAWQAAQQHLGSALSFAILYDDLINNYRDRLEQASPTQTRERQGVGQLTATEDCPACRVWNEASASAASLIAENKSALSVIEAVRNSEGLCLAHLAQALESITSPDHFALLKSIHLQKLDTLQKELKEFMRKNDYRFSHEPFQSESDSWVRALRALHGVKKGSHD